MPFGKGQPPVLICAHGEPRIYAGVLFLYPTALCLRIAPLGITLKPLGWACLDGLFPTALFAGAENDVLNPRVSGGRPDGIRRGPLCGVREILTAKRGKPPPHRGKALCGKNPEGIAFGIFWRRKRDLNPRGTFAPYSLSRGAPSPLGYFSVVVNRLEQQRMLWRRGWDSNPRLSRVTGFQDQLLKPLGHLSNFVDGAYCSTIKPLRQAEKRLGDTVLMRKGFPV